MKRPTAQSIDAIKAQVMQDLAAVRAGQDLEALASLETFVAIAFEVFSATNPSKLKAAMVTVELRNYIPPGQKAA